MSLTTETSQSTYTGNGSTTVFATGFRFKLNTEIVVKVTNPGGVETIYTQGLSYSVSGAGDDAGGSVTFTLAAPVSGAAIVIERTVAITQLVSLTTQGPYNARTLEDALDEGTMVDQQLDRRLTAIENGSLTGDFEAGNGLTVSGITLSVGAGNGIISNADDIEVSYGGAPANVTKAAASAGVANSASRSDHKHDVTTAVAGSASVGDAAAEGSSTSLARADHAHAFAAPAAPANVTKAAASAGSSGNFARQDHKHDVTTAAPGSIGVANAEGSATSLSRSDHVHSHGVQSDETHHAVATSSTAGFMSAADKVILDSLSTTPAPEKTKKVTTNATETMVVDLPIEEDAVEVMEITVIGSRRTNSYGAGYVFNIVAKTLSNVASIIGIDLVTSAESTSGWNARCIAYEDGIRVLVTGGAYTVDWVVYARRRTTFE